MGKTLAARMARTIGAAAVFLGTITGATIVAVPTASAATASVPSSAAVQYPTPPFAQHVTKFGTAAWVDVRDGTDVYVEIPLREYFPGVGWLGSPHERITVREMTRHGWRVRATLRTDSDGMAHGFIRFGGAGSHRVQAVHDPDVWTYGTVGRVRTVVTTAPDGTETI